MAKSKFYSNEAAVPAKKLANKPSIGNANLYPPTPKMVPANPGKSTAFGGATQAFGHPPAGGSHGFGHSIIQRLGSMRISGVKGAHRVGKR